MRSETMKGFRRRLHPFTVGVVLVVVGFGIFLIYSRRIETTSPTVQPTMLREPAPAYDEYLGIMWKPTRSPEPEGNKIVSFRPSRATSTAALLGVIPGDILVSVNDKPLSPDNVREAIAELKKDGKPITLIVYRMGQKITLKTDELPEKPSFPAGGPPAGRAGGPGA
jgi:membrane-associated protease RseP (regulator of RpoE activity)